MAAVPRWVYTLRARVGLRTRLREWRRARANAPLIRAFLETQPRRLHLGCGDNLLPGWLNSDLHHADQARGVAEIDIARPLPFPDRSCDLLFAEHLIEHVAYQHALAFLREAHRVLGPGGIIRLATPNLRAVASLGGGGHDWYLDSQAWYLETIYPDAPPLPGFMVNTLFRNWGHQFIYDAETLAWTLEQAGFRDAVELAVGESDHPDLRQIEGHGQITGERANRWETLVMEARRP